MPSLGAAEGRHVPQGPRHANTLRVKACHANDLRKDIVARVVSLLAEPDARRHGACTESRKPKIFAMLTGLFQSTTIPVLQEVVNFSQARHTVLAGNIANIDTPGYQARDLSVEDFQARLKQAIDDRDQPPLGSPGETELAARPLMAEVAKSSQSILRHDMGNVD